MTGARPTMGENPVVDAKPIMGAKPVTDARLSDIPFKAYFQFAFPLYLLAGEPPMTADPGRWPTKYELPVTSLLDGIAPCAKVFSAWSEAGLWFGFDVTIKGRPRPRRERFWDGDACEVWVDTRGSRDAHKPTRYCHHFYLLPGASPGDKPSAGFVRYPKVRAESDDPDPADVGLVGNSRDGGYVLEAFFPRKTLLGYDPDQSSTIGLCYSVCCPTMGRMHLSFVDGFRVFQDPSMWASCTLTRS